MRVTAFCPGHLTGFFFPCEHEDPLRSGSRGAGLCVDQGATSMVSVKEGSGEISINVNGRGANAPVTRTAVTILLGDRTTDVRIDTRLDLPVSAGFGMSAAGALSASFALAEALELSVEDAFAAAHRAELSNRTGLGDVPALTAGGLTFRKKEGLPPYGQVDRLATRLDIVATVVGESMRTANVLADAGLRERIGTIGRECYRSLCLEPTVSNFFSVSRDFTERTGLASPRVLEALKEVDAHGKGSMIMLGNSVFATGELDELQGILQNYGQTYRLRLDALGPRVLDIEY
jgi:pantoate kinase